MSRGARWVIAAVALVCAFIFMVTALDTSGLPGSPIIFSGLSALCLIIAIACLFPKSHSITLRLIGLAILAAYLAYFFSSDTQKESSKAIQGLIQWGIPSGYLAITGGYPSWGKAGQVFAKSKSSEDD